MDEAEATPSESTSEEPGQAPEAADPESEAPEFPRDIPLPPATFDFLVLSLRSQAEMHLGLLHFGEEKDRPRPNLPLARHSIDMLAMLLEKTKGNLTTDEHRMLENSVTELRFRFVEASKGGAG